MIGSDSPLASFELELRPNAGPVIGRPIELSTIEQALDAVAAGGLRAVTVEGEPGIGKTRLVEATAELASGRGFGVLSAISDEELRGPLLVARSLFVSPSARRLAAGMGEESVLGRLVESLSGHGDPTMEHAAGDRQLIHLYDQAAMVLRALAAHAPVALLLDDVQWADQDSVRMIRYVVRSATDRLFVMLAFRSEHAEASETATLVADMERLRVARRLRLGRFTNVETGELLRQLLDADLAPSTVAAIHSQAEGVPFMVEELGRAYREAGLLQLVEGRWQLPPKAERLIPPSVEMLTRRRVNRLPEATQVSLAEAAVIGRTFGLRDLAAVKERIEGEKVLPGDLAEALEPAVEAGLLSELPEASGADYRFPHEQIRRYLAGTVPRTRRRGIHAAIVDLVTAGGKPPDSALAMLAHHSLEAGHADRCARFSVQAARVALDSNAPEEVLRLVDQGLSSAANPEDRVAMLQLRDDALAALRRTPDRLETLSQLAALAQALGDPGLDIDVKLRRSAALRGSEEEDRAAELAGEAQHMAAERGDSRAELAASLELGQALLRSSLGEAVAPKATEVDVDGAEKAYLRAASLAEEIGDVGSLAAAKQELGVVLMARARVQVVRWLESERPQSPAEVATRPEVTEPFMAGLDLFREAAELFEEAGDRSGMMGAIVAMAEASKVLSVRFGSASRLEQVRRLVVRMGALTRESDRELQEAQLLYSVHLYARAFGFPDLALERGADAYEAARRVGDRGLEFLSSGGMALSHLAMGEVDEAVGWLERATRAAAAAPSPVRTRQLETWEGMAAAGRGDAEGMARHLGLALSIATEHGKPASRCEVLARLAIESALLGDRQGDGKFMAEADRWATEAARVAGTLVGDHPWSAQSDAARALVLDAEGRRGEAREAARGALDGLEKMGMRESEPPYPLHLDVVLAAARVLSRLGGDDAEWARERLQAIVRLMGERTADEDVRVRWFRGPVQRELVELAGAPEIAAAEPEVSMLTLDLSEGEASILSLVSSGMTNEEIAAELDFSEDQVARDLTAIYAKLGVSSRAGASLYAFLGGVA